MVTRPRSSRPKSPSDIKWAKVRKELNYYQDILGAHRTSIPKSLRKAKKWHPKNPHLGNR